MFYYNTHTHRKPAQNEFCIRNAYLPSQQFVIESKYALSVGIHPWFTSKYNLLETKTKLHSLAVLNNVFAIGEIGLDRLKGENLEFQQKWFEMQIEIAIEVEKPIIIHAVKTIPEVISLLKSKTVKWVIHGFNGNSVLANQIINAGGLISIGKSLITSTHLKQTLLTIPTDKILLETDAKNILIMDIYAEFGMLFQLDYSQVHELVDKNFQLFFQKSI